MTIIDMPDIELDTLHWLLSLISHTTICRHHQFLRLRIEFMMASLPREATIGRNPAISRAKVTSFVPLPSGRTAKESEAEPAAAIVACAKGVDSTI
jgi:hypothetical protein